MMKLIRIIGATTILGVVVACSTERLLDVNAPNAVPVTVTLTLYDGTTGAQIGSPFTRVWGPFEAAQVSNVTASLGAGSVTTANAILVATSSGGAVFFYGATVDNLSGDSFLLTRSADEVPVP